MSEEEKYLIALGNLQSMAIDNTKGSKVVEICANDIRDYLDKYKEVIDKIKEYCEYNDDSLYTFEPDYDYEENIVDKYEPSNFREDILELLEEIE